MNQPKVSVIMSVYNGEKYLREAVDSILAQTFTDFEFIIINDGSTDKTKEILSSYDDERIVVIDQQNVGLTKSLNRGIKMAKGEYIARMDADDISLPERLEKQVRFLDHNRDIVLVGTSPICINENGKAIETGNVSTASDEIKKNLLNGNQFTHGSVMFRKSCIEAVGFYREEFDVAQDYDLWLRISEVFGVGNIEEPLYKWRINPKSIAFVKKDKSEEAASLAVILARERRKSGKESLHLVSTRREKSKTVGTMFLKARVKIRKISAGNYYFWGRRLFYQGAYKDAREFLLKSLVNNPFCINTWRLLILATLSKKWTTRIRKLKRTLLGINIQN